MSRDQSAFARATLSRRFAVGTERVVGNVLEGAERDDGHGEQLEDVTKKNQARYEPHGARRHAQQVAQQLDRRMSQ